VWFVTTSSSLTSNGNHITHMKILFSSLGTWMDVKLCDISLGKYDKFGVIKLKIFHPYDDNLNLQHYFYYYYLHPSNWRKKNNLSKKKFVSGHMWMNHSNNERKHVWEAHVKGKEKFHNGNVIKMWFNISYYVKKMNFIQVNTQLLWNFIFLTDVRTKYFNCEEENKGATTAEASQNWLKFEIHTVCEILNGAINQHRIFRNPVIKHPWWKWQYFIYINSKHSFRFLLLLSL
jgi:hypothetical protein